MTTKRNIPKLTPEEIARAEETQRLARQRIAEREAMEREMEEMDALKTFSWFNRLRLRIARVVAP